MCIHTCGTTTCRRRYHRTPLTALACPDLLNSRAIARFDFHGLRADGSSGIFGILDLGLILTVFHVHSSSMPPNTRCALCSS